MHSSLNNPQSDDTWLEKKIISTVTLKSLAEGFSCNIPVILCLEWRMLMILAKFAFRLPCWISDHLCFHWTCSFKEKCSWGMFGKAYCHTSLAVYYVLCIFLIWTLLYVKSLGSVGFVLREINSKDPLIRSKVSVKTKLRKELKINLF